MLSLLPLLDESPTCRDSGSFVDGGDSDPTTNPHSPWRYEVLDATAATDGMMNLDPSDTQAQGQCQPSGEVPAFLLQQQNRDGVPSCEGAILWGCLMSTIRDDPQAPVKEAFCTVALSMTRATSKAQTTQPAGTRPRASVETQTKGLQTRRSVMRVQKKRLGNSKGTTVALRTGFESARGTSGELAMTQTNGETHYSLSAS